MKNINVEKFYNIEIILKNFSTLMFFMLIFEGNSLLLQCLHKKNNYQKLLVKVLKIQISPPASIS
jgi:hypothetical protein